MYAIEFEAKIENGVVNIPKEYCDIYQSKARILVLVDDAEIKAEGKKDYSAFFSDLRNRHINVSPEIDIDQLMRSDYEICDEGLRVLFSAMDILDAEKFISLIKQDTFDYTEWRRSLWENQSLDAICWQGEGFSKKLRL